MPICLLLFVGAVGVLVACQSTATPPDTPYPTADAFQNPHESSEGVMLGSQKGETVFPGTRCPANAPVRAYALAAINVEITLNRFLDYDPQGEMFVLESDLARVRTEEAQNRRARETGAEPGASTGLQGDAIQPLALRVNRGECLRIVLHNLLPDNEPASFHLHAAGLVLADDGSPAVALNPHATIRPGDSVTYEWMTAQDEPEGTHYFHSHGDDRFQSDHGLFGAVVVEPGGARYLNPRTGAQESSGWDAIITLPDGSSFREFALFYHDIGDDTFLPLARDGQPNVFADRMSGTYRPGSRALNYRSEPFADRLQLQQDVLGRFDKSASYSSYAFGDPATPMMRSYLGDRVKQRVIHGGGEVFHVHHVHGGSIRWLRQPGTQDLNSATGLNKHPPLTPNLSERTDSQSLGPSETFDVENECGSGGCQQSVGDYLYHCHVAQHYFAGMWGIWRVYNTLQTTGDGQQTLDGLAPLLELPDRRGTMQGAVTSDQLVGKTVQAGDSPLVLTDDNLDRWVTRQLPPQGVPLTYDASVFDWQKRVGKYWNEPEDAHTWVNFKSAAPDERVPLLFDPQTGKLAYPFLHPHLGKRPPFAPNHGPAPYLDPVTNGVDPPLPGANGAASVCPANTRLRKFTIEAIGLPLAINQRMSLIDPLGSLYVLKEQEADVRARSEMQAPLAIRANAGEDCVDVLFKSQLPDNAENNNFSKADIHIHFVQFDVQASDGVDTGFNYEQGVRPYTVEGERITEQVAPGETRVPVTNGARFHPNTLVGVGMEQTATFEVARIARVQDNVLELAGGLDHAHAANEIVSAEFVRYRWYPDAQVGTAYFHDHVDALQSWRHGLFGALIVEPPGATYHDPHTGGELESGAIADIHTTARLSVDVQGSFRELVAFLQDNNLMTFIGDSAGSSLNLRAEPLTRRALEPKEIPRPFDPLAWLRELFGAPKPIDDKSAFLFSSRVFGDPATPRLEAYLGDPLVLRTLVAGTNDIHTFHLDGHWFRTEPWNTSSPPVNTVHVGISERYDIVVPQAGGPQGMPGDYLYYDAREFKVREGSWGIVRVYDGVGERTLQKLPGHETIPTPSSRVCPTDAPVKTFDLDAMETALPMLESTPGRVFVLHKDKASVEAGTRQPQPLVLHVNVSDCVRVRLTNDLTTTPVSFNVQLLAFDPNNGYGVAAGNDAAQHVMPGETREYEYYASPEVGETVALVRDGANVLENPRLGLYGAIVVGPRGAHFTDPATGADLAGESNWRADVNPPQGAPWRDFVLFLQDQDAGIGTHRMPYVSQVAGTVGMNYQRARLSARRDQRQNVLTLFDVAAFGMPATPLLEAYPGDALHVHVLAPSSEQSHVFTIEDHTWAQEPGLAGTNWLSAVEVGAMEAQTIVVDHAGTAGDYLYGDHRAPYQDAGLWGILRVYDPAHPAALYPLK